MANRKPNSTRASKTPPAASKTPDRELPAANAAKSSSRSTVSGPSVQPATAKALANDALSLQAAGTAELAAAFPNNAAKAAEFAPAPATDNAKRQGCGRVRRRHWQAPPLRATQRSPISLITE